MYILAEQITISIYVLDDQKDDLDLICRRFEKEGIINCKYFIDHDKFIEEFYRGVDLSIVDFSLATTKTGMDIIDEVLEVHPFGYHIMVSGAASPKDVAAFFRDGVDDFVLKDFEFYDELVVAVRRALPLVERRRRIAKKWWPEYYVNSS